MYIYLFRSASWFPRQKIVIFGQADKCESIACHGDEIVFVAALSDTLISKGSWSTRLKVHFQLQPCVLLVHQYANLIRDFDTFPTKDAHWLESRFSASLTSMKQ